MKLFGAFAVAVMGAAVAGCAAEQGDESEATDSAEEDLTPGVNGGACKNSPFDCKLRVSGGNRILTNDGGELWHVKSGEDVLDGNGNVLGVEKSTQMAFNFGQVRVMRGKAHAFAMSTSNGSSGWYPMDAIEGKASFDQKVGR